MHLKHFPLFRLFNRKPRGQGVYLWLAGCQTGCLHFRQSLHTKLLNILLIFHTFDPRNIFYICLTDSWILFHRQEHGQLFLKCLAEKDSCTGKKSNQLAKKTMIQRFFPLKHLISNNIDQVRPLGRWKGACCRWISWLWSTWPVRSELLWGGHNPLIWVFDFLFVFNLSTLCFVWLYKRRAFNMNMINFSSLWFPLLGLFLSVDDCHNFSQPDLPGSQVFDLTTMTWTETGSLPEGMDGNALVAINRGPWAGQVWLEIKSNMRTEIW